MQYCPKNDCPRRNFFQDDDHWCSACQTELTPALVCRCSIDLPAYCQVFQTVNPKQEQWRWQQGEPPRYCHRCGFCWDETGIGLLISLNFKKLVGEVVTRFSTTNGTPPPQLPMTSP